MKWLDIQTAWQMRVVRANAERRWDMRARIARAKSRIAARDIQGALSLPDGYAILADGKPVDPSSPLTGTYTIETTVRKRGR